MINHLPASATSACAAIILSVAVAATPHAQTDAQNESRASDLFALSSQLEATRSANIETLAALGYIDRSHEIPRAEYVQARMQERMSLAETAGKDKSPANLGFYDVSEGLPPAAQAYEPALMQRRFLSGRSRSYLLPGGDSIKQLHTETQFGTIIIDEFKNATVVLESPNTKVNGHPATVTHLRYQGDRWATAVYVAAGKRFFVVEADRKLVGKQRDVFLEMARTLVSGARM